MPVSRATCAAVAEWSPVSSTTLYPAALSRLTVRAAFGRSVSARPMTPTTSRSSATNTAALPAARSSSAAFRRWFDRDLRVSPERLAAYYVKAVSPVIVRSPSDARKE